MASNTSKALPFIVLAVAIALSIYQAETGKVVPLETLIPILAPIGVAGAVKSAIEKVAEAKKVTDQAVKEFKESG
jgi:hypothetical protein